MTQAWFVSDIHIADMQDEKAGKFLAFLSSLGRDRACTQLFLVGDIFDLWVGDHFYFVKKFGPIVLEVKRLVSEGVEVHYFEGNHDLHLSRYFSGELGVVVHMGPEYFYLGGQTIRVEHGDQSDPEDKGYRFLRWFLRTPPLKLLSYRLPGSVVNAIGEKASVRSRAYTSKSKTIDEITARRKLHEHAERAYTEMPFDLLIYGHVHIRDDYRAKGFRAINLGTWLLEPGVLHVTEEEVQWVSIL